MSAETVLELLQLMFWEVDLDIPRVIQSVLQPYFFDGTYSP